MEEELFIVTREDLAKIHCDSTGKAIISRSDQYLQSAVQSIPEEIKFLLERVDAARRTADQMRFQVRNLNGNKTSPERERKILLDQFGVPSQIREIDRRLLAVNRELLNFQLYSFEMLRRELCSVLVLQQFLQKAGLPAGAVAQFSTLAHSVVPSANCSTPFEPSVKDAIQMFKGNWDAELAQPAQEMAPCEEIQDDFEVNL